MTSVFTCTI